MNGPKESLRKYDVCFNRGCLIPAITKYMKAKILCDVTWIRLQKLFGLYCRLRAFPCFILVHKTLLPQLTAITPVVVHHSSGLRPITITENEYF